MYQFFAGVAAAAFLICSSANAGFDGLPPVCARLHTPLVCDVLVDIAHDVETFERAVDDGMLSVYDAEDALRLFVRFELAEGDLSRAIEMSDKIGSPTITVVADPLPNMNPDDLPDPQSIDVDQVGDWALIMTARALAANGQTENAGTAFQMAADRVTDGSLYGGWSDARVLRSIGAYYFTPWAAAGFADDALQYADSLEPAAQAWAMLFIADGLAMRGDVGATKAVVESMSGQFTVLGQMSLAEAYRQAGKPATGLTVLDGAAHEFEFLMVGLRDRKAQRRLAMAYALLGDLETAEYVMARAAYAPNMASSGWRDIAPAIACHDIDLALELIARRYGASDSTPYRNPEAVVEILVSAAASDQGDMAYAFAKQEDNLLKRLSFLTAVVVGLRQAEDVLSDAIPCATLNTLPRM